MFWQLEEKKRKAKLEEMEKLAGKVDLGHKSGVAGDKSNDSLRPGGNLN